MKPEIPDRDANLSKLDVALSELHEINSSFGIEEPKEEKKHKKKKRQKKDKAPEPEEILFSNKRAAPEVREEVKSSHSSEKEQNIP